MKSIWIPMLAAALALFSPTYLQADDVTAFRYITPKTDVVIHMDATHINFEAQHKWMQNFIKHPKMDDANREKIDPDAPSPAGLNKEWVSNFKKAGGKDLYLVLNLNDQASEEFFTLVIPLPKGADAGALTKLISPRLGGFESAVIGDNLVFTASENLDAFKNMTAGARPLLGQSLEMKDDSPLQIAMKVSGLKQLLVLMNAADSPAAKLLDDPAFAKVTCCAATLISPPEVALEVAIQCDDADAATALAKVISHSIDELKFDHAMIEAFGENLDTLVAALKPKTDGSKVMITLDRKVMDILMSKYVNARSAAK